MSMYRIQFQPGVSMPKFFFSCYGTEAQCAAALLALRWPQGFRCPRCSSAEHYVVGHGARKLFQCRGCRRQTSLTSGTVMDSTKLPLTAWFLAIYLVSQDKTGLSALALMRHLGTSYVCIQPPPRGQAEVRDKEARRARRPVSLKAPAPAAGLAVASCRSRR